MYQDLTTGSPGRVLWHFSLPLLGSMLFQQFYNLTDSLVVGKLVSENALAAVGNSYEITLLYLAFAVGINVGCSVVVGQLFGARQYGEVKTAVYTTLLSGSMVCLALMLFGLVFADSLLSLIQTPATVLNDSLCYLRIYTLGLPFVFYYNISTGIFSALGDSRTPFLFLATSSVANVTLDLLFVCVFDLGVAGVAWATFLCQGISCVLAVTVVLRRLYKIPAGEGRRLFSSAIFLRIARIAVPTILQQTFISVANVIIQGFVNAFGAAVMAGYAASIKLNNMIISAMTTLGNGVSNFTAQNLGAKKHHRIRQGHRAGLIMVWLLIIPVTAVLLLYGKNLVAIFMEVPDGDAAKEGLRFLRTVCAFYPVIAVKLISDGVLKGSGMMKEFMLGTFSDMILRVFSAWLLSGFFGSAGIWMAWPASWMVGTALSVYYTNRSFSGHNNS